ncbi:MAG TPA: thioredoxin domain-containing protein [Pyrinomonadaceae bacterium]|nr:thioredoxin domain-containing protein [Pyrinomonadaceae bacterium]
MRILITPLAICLLASATFAQRTRQRPPAKRPAATQSSTTPATPPAGVPASPTRPAQSLPPLTPVSIVVINGRTITSAEFEPAVREAVESVDREIAETKQELLDLQINTLLLQAEARKRGITTERLYALEVSSKLAQPTPAEVKKFIEEHPQEFSGLDSTVVSSQVATYLLNEREEKISLQFIERLKKMHAVVPGVDINTPGLKDDAVVASVDGQTVKAGAINERLKPIAYRVRMTAYEKAKTRADGLINDALLLDEAGKRGIGPEQIVRAEITDKAKAPTEAEIRKFYDDNKARITGDFEQVRYQIAEYLQALDRQRLEKELSARLQKGANIRWLLIEPTQPVQAVSTDDDPSRGDVNAAVTVVEFTDFQCPSCALMHPVLEEVLKPYGNSVRLVVRDFPLSMHENALKAAEAANAANAQGKFFEYIALLYKRQKALDTPSLKKYASELGLNRQKFDAELDSGTYAGEIKRDITDGEIYGVGSTPTIFVNGVMLRVLSAEGLKQAIDHAAAARRAGAPPK